MKRQRQSATKFHARRRSKKFLSRDTERTRGGTRRVQHSHHVHTYTCHASTHTYTHAHIYRKCYLRDSWQGPCTSLPNARSVLNISARRHYWCICYIPLRIYNWPARCVSTDRSTCYYREHVLLPPLRAIRRRNPSRHVSFTFDFLPSWVS